MVSRIWTGALKERKCVSSKVLSLLCLSTWGPGLSSQRDINTALKTTALYTDPKVLAPEYLEYPKSSVWFKSQQWNTIFPRGHAFITPTTYHNWLQGSGLSQEDVTGIKAAFPAFLISSSNTFLCRHSNLLSPEFVFISQGQMTWVFYR